MPSSRGISAGTILTQDLPGQAEFEEDRQIFSNRFHNGPAAVTGLYSFIQSNSIKPTLVLKALAEFLEPKLRPSYPFVFVSSLWGNSPRTIYCPDAGPGMSSTLHKNMMC